MAWPLKRNLKCPKAFALSGPGSGTSGVWALGAKSEGCWSQCCLSSPLSVKAFPPHVDRLSLPWLDCSTTFHSASDTTCETWYELRFDWPGVFSASKPTWHQVSRWIRSCLEIFLFLASKILYEEYSLVDVTPWDVLKFSYLAGKIQGVTCCWGNMVDAQWVPGDTWWPKSGFGYKVKGSTSSLHYHIISLSYHNKMIWVFLGPKGRMEQGQGKPWPDDLRTQPEGVTGHFREEMTEGF